MSDFFIILIFLFQEISEQQLLEREKIVRKLRDELRNEEMTLVLLKKLRQSHQMKENIAVVAPCNNNQTPVQGPVHAKPTPPRSSSKPVSQPALHLLNRVIFLFNIICYFIG